MLPDGFKKIRHYGLYASSARDELELACTELERLGAPAPTWPAPRPTWQQLLRELTGRDVERCARCAGAIERIAIERQTARGPPVQEVA